MWSYEHQRTYGKLKRDSFPVAAKKYRNFLMTEQQISQVLQDLTYANICYIPVSLAMYTWFSCSQFCMQEVALHNSANEDYLVVREMVLWSTE